MNKKFMLRVLILNLFVIIVVLLCLPKYFPEVSSEHNPALNQSFNDCRIRILGLNHAGQFAEALSFLDEVAPKLEKVQHAGLFYFLAMDCYDSENFKEARTVIEKAIRKYPSYGNLRALYASLMAKMGNKDKALKALKRYPGDFDTFDWDIKKKPLNIYEAYHIAAAYALLGNPDLAMSYLSFFWYHEAVGLKEGFNMVYRDSDFNSLHQDERFNFIRDMAYAAPFEDVLSRLERQFDRYQELISGFYMEKGVADKRIKELKQVLSNVRAIKTSARDLFEIRSILVMFIEETIHQIKLVETEPLYIERPDLREAVQAEYTVINKPSLQALRVKFRQAETV